MEIVIDFVDTYVGEISEMTGVYAEYRYFLFPYPLGGAQESAVAPYAESYGGVEIVALYYVVDFGRRL